MYFLPGKMLLLFREAIPVEITVQNGEVTSKTTSLTVNLSGVLSSGILRVVQLDAGDTYDAGKLNGYTSLHFSVLELASYGETVPSSYLELPTPGKQLLVVVRDAGGSIVDYVSSPILVAEEQTEPDPGSGENAGGDSEKYQRNPDEKRRNAYGEVHTAGNFRGRPRKTGRFRG